MSYSPRLKLEQHGEAIVRVVDPPVAVHLQLSDGRGEGGDLEVMERYVCPLQPTREALSDK